MADTLPRAQPGTCREPLMDDHWSTGSRPKEPDANAIIGLLADADRRRVLAAVELGATTLDQVATATGLDDRRVAKALGKLVDRGVVSATTERGFAVAGDVLAAAARDALRRPPNEEHAAEPAEVRRVLDAFVRGGRIVSMPSAPSKQRVVLDWLARRFEPGRRYPEAEVTDMLAGQAVDPATLRRYLIDAAFLDRTAGVYWRVGGTFEPAR